MIGYVTIGATDSDASGKFYDAVLGACGNERAMLTNSNAPACSRIDTV